MRRTDSAGRLAHEVVGLYGDPDTTWGICLEVGLVAPAALLAARGRVADLFDLHPHLGPRPVIEDVSAEAWEDRRAATGATPYAIGGPLVRLLVSEDRRKILVAAHHGVCDGLGLVAIADAVAGVGLVSAARGIGDRAAPRTFWRSSLGRLREALMQPPPRFVSHIEDHSDGENLVLSSGPRIGAGTADLCVAVGAVFTTWNRDRDGNAGRPLYVSGASRRLPGTLAPDRQTAYLRFRPDPGWGREQVQAAFAELDPEPEFPVTSAGGIGPRVTRLLRARLGATAQLSNLGVIEGDGLDYAAMFPALSGPRGLAVGLVSTARSTTLSLRTRGSEFGPTDTATLLDLILVELRAVARDQAQ